MAAAKHTPVFKPDLYAPPWKVHAEIVRAKGHIVTPYRLGYAVGYSGEETIVCPYTLQRSADAFRYGLRYGRDAAIADRKKAAAIAKATEASHG
jgi:hypothetical protein